MGDAFWSVFAVSAMVGAAYGAHRLIVYTHGGTTMLAGLACLVLAVVAIKVFKS